MIARFIKSPQARSIALFAVSSFAATLLAKILITRLFFDYPIVIMMIQMAASLFLIELLRVCNLVKLQPYTFDKGRHMFLPSTLLSVSSWLAVSSYEGIGLPLFDPIKRLTPLLIIIFGVIFFKRPRPERSALFAVAAVSFASSLAVNFEYSMDRFSLCYGLIGAVFHAIAFIQIENLSSSYSALEMTYMHSFNSLVLFLIADIVQDEIRDAFMYIMTSSNVVFFSFFLFLTGAGVIMQFATFYSVVEAGGLTTSVVANARAAFQTLAAFAFSWFLFYDLYPGMLNWLAFLAASAAFLVFLRRHAFNGGYERVHQNGAEWGQNTKFGFARTLMHRFLENNAWLLIYLVSHTTAAICFDLLVTSLFFEHPGLLLMIHGLLGCIVIEVVKISPLGRRLNSSPPLSFPHFSFLFLPGLLLTLSTHLHISAKDVEIYPAFFRIQSLSVGVVFVLCCMAAGTVRRRMGTAILAAVSAYSAFSVADVDSVAPTLQSGAAAAVAASSLYVAILIMSSSTATAVQIFHSHCLSTLIVYFAIELYQHEIFPATSYILCRQFALFTPVLSLALCASLISSYSLAALASSPSHLFHVAHSQNISAAIQYAIGYFLSRFVTHTPRWKEYSSTGCFFSLLSFIASSFFLLKRSSRRVHRRAIGSL